MSLESAAFAGEEEKVFSEPTEADIQVLKSIHQGKPLYKTTIAKNTYIYTYLSLGTDRDVGQAQMKQNITPQQAEEWYQTRVLEECVLWPRGFNISNLGDQPAGISYTLFQKIMSVSAMAEPAITSEAIEEPAACKEPTGGDISALKSDERLKRLGLMKRTVEQRWLDPSGRLQSKVVGTFIYTALERAVYNKITREAASATAGPPPDLDLMVVRSAVVWPKDFDWDGAPAGFVDVCSTGIMQLSGFSAVTTIVNDEEL